MNDPARPSTPCAMVETSLAAPCIATSGSSGSAGTSPQAAGPDLVICIPTYRRPKELRALLESLASEVDSASMAVIIADNDAGPSTAAVIDAMNVHLPRPEVIAVAERGVVAVRNALVKAALRAAPEWRWIVMIDDDGEVTPGWLSSLVQTGERFGVQLVGGPVQGVLPAHASRLARNSVFASRRRWPTGPVPILNGTCNLAISRSVLSLLPQPLFQPEYGRSGGEDYDFFRRVARAGGKMAWCDEAVVIEPTPANRLTVGSLLSRYANSGTYMARIDKSYDGRRAAWRETARGLAGSVFKTARGVVCLDPDMIARGVLYTAHQAGRVAGMLGVTSARYAEPAPKRRT